MVVLPLLVTVKLRKMLSLSYLTHFDINKVNDCYIFGQYHLLRLIATLVGLKMGTLVYIDCVLSHSWRDLHCMKMDQI